MTSLFEKIIGVPLSAARQREEIALYLRFRDAATMRAVMNENLSHITQKSGALLAAQAIFIVVDTYGIEHRWPQLAVLASTLMLVLAALIVMTNLRSTYLASSPAVEDPAQLELESVAQTAWLASTRGARFNIALYLTFLSIVLLGFGAFEASAG
jgi:hypothetical protein